MTTPPITCKPCRVRYAGQVFFIAANGSVWEAQKFGMEGDWQPVGEPLERESAQRVRREAQRLRRNRNARERHQAMRSLGLVKTAYGWE